jgi:glycosyltransferase involved in cell wall biosynthesis
LITSYWKNSDGGGIKTYLVNLVNTLTERSVDVRVIFRKGRDQENIQGHENKLAFSISCYRHLLDYRPDAIHTQGDWYCLLPGALYKRIHGCRLINTFHTEPEVPIGRLEKVIMRYLLNACDHVTFVSLGLQKRIIEIDGLTTPNAAITYAGVKVGEVLDGDVKQFMDDFGIDESSITITTLGMTALPYKVQGLKLLIEAIRILRVTFPDIMLVVIREGEYSNEVKAFAREMKVEQNVIFTGNIDNPLVPLKMCAVYAHTPLGEGGVSLALLEAMSMGKPIVATSVGGIPEAITDRENGLLVEPEVQQIVEGIAFLLQNRDYSEQLGRSAKRTVEEKFTWANSAKVFESLYTS